MENTESKTLESAATELSPLLMVDKIIDLFVWVVRTFLKLGIGLVIGLTVIVVVVAIVISVGLSSGQITSESLAPFAAALTSSTGATSIFTTIFGQVNILAGNVWSFLAPVLQFVIVIVLLRWLLVSPEGRASTQLRNIVRDVPSVIAVLIVGTLCLVTIMKFQVPDVISNVALVIVGFYFGQERLKRVLEEEDKNQEKADLPLGTAGKSKKAA